MIMMRKPGFFFNNSYRISMAINNNRNCDNKEYYLGGGGGD
jgi:hypothetical protein